MSIPFISVFQTNICIHKPFPLRIINPAPQIIQSRLLIVHIPTIAERIQRTNRRCQTAGFADRITPRIITIFYHLRTIRVNQRRYRQVLCANSFTSLAELSLHRAGKPALNYLVAEGRERVKGGEAACEALDVNSVFCYQPASFSCISMYFMLMYFFPPHWVPAT